MKKYLLVFLTLFFASLSYAQQATITGSVSDSDGTLWSHATVTAVLDVNPHTNVRYINQSWPVQTQVQISVNGYALFPYYGAMQLASNAAILPANTQWYLLICPDISAPCQQTPDFTVPLSDTFDVTNFIKANLTGPRIAPGYNVKAYADIEISSPAANDVYLNEYTDIWRTYDGASWKNLYQQANSGAYSVATSGGLSYSGLGAAWAAAVNAAESSGQNQTITLGNGTFPVAGTLSEPTNGTCVSIIGIGGNTTQQIYNTTPVGQSSTNIIWQGGASNADLFSLQNASGTQAQSCTFKNLTIYMAGDQSNGLKGSAFNFQWFRGLTLENLTINDSGNNAIILGEASGTHQSNVYIHNVVISYEYNGASGYTPASRPAYGLQMLPTTIDSNVDTLFCRNAQTACVDEQGTGSFFIDVHGFGFPYACTTAPCNNHETVWNAPDASYASDYVIYDTGADNSYTDTYMDSPAIAALYIGANGVSVNNGILTWPDQTSFPNANLASVAATVSSGLVISNVNCTNMAPTSGAPSSPAGATGVWISYFLTDGNAPQYSTVSGLAGCGNYVQERIAARQTAFDIAGNNSSNTNFGATGVVPKVFVTPLSTSPAEGGVECENFNGGQSDCFYSGLTAQPSNFAVRYSGSVKTQGLQTNVQNFTAAATLTVDNQFVTANASGGAFTLTLPSCFTPMVDGLTPTGMKMTIAKTDTSSNAVNLATTSGEAIFWGGNSNSTFSLSKPSTYTFVCGTDSNWYLTNQSASLGTWDGAFIGTFGGSTATSLGSIWTPSTPVLLTRLDIALGSAPSGCSTFPTIGIYDATAAAWLKTSTLSTFFSYRSSITPGIVVPSGHNLQLGVQTAGVGCSSLPGTAQLNIEYLSQ